MKSIRHNNLKTGRLRGAAIIELALTLPLILLMVFATVDVCNRIYLQQTLKILAYEGARVSTIPGATRDDVVQHVQELANDRNVVNLQVDVSPNDFENASFGTFISVDVQADAAQGLTQFFTANQCVATVSMMKESE